MKPYLEATSGHRKNALALYRWNMGISGAFYQGLHIFEVALRNSMDEQLKIWNAAQVDAQGRLYDGEWCKRPADPLLRILGSDLPEAQDRAKKALLRSNKTRDPNHDDIVAHMSLSAWRFLLPSKTDPGKAALWEDGLKNAFPNLVRPLQQLIDAVENVYRLRNRIAHLEPLHKVNLEASLKNMQTVIADVSAPTATWFVTSTPIRDILDRRPKFL